MHKFENVSLDNEIDDCTVLGLLSDKNSVWIITNKKVLQYNIDSQTFQHYSTADDNIMVDVFRYRLSAWTVGAGSMWRTPWIHTYSSR